MKFELEFYVLNWNINEKKAEMFNIFRNHNVKEEIEKEVKKYLQDPNGYIYTDYIDPMKNLNGYEAIKKQIDRIIMWQEYGRSEYEIVVSSMFGDEEEKWDCYSQAHANIDLITKMCLEFYDKSRVKIQ